MQLQVYPLGATVSWNDEDVKSLDFVKDVPIDLIEFDDLSRMAYKLGTRLRHWIFSLDFLNSLESSTMTAFFDTIDGADTRLIFSGWDASTYVVRCLADGSQFNSKLPSRYEGKIILQEYIP